MSTVLDPPSLHYDAGNQQQQQQYCSYSNDQYYQRDAVKPKAGGGYGTGKMSKEGKPQYSYASLIRLAISNCPKGKMTLSEIYQFIMQTFPYYREAGTGWKNSIRHNLSLNKCFTKVARSKDDPGKGSYWAIDYNYSHDEGFIKKKKGHLTRNSPYSPECSSNSSDYSNGGSHSKMCTRIPNDCIGGHPIETPDRQEIKEYNEIIEEENNAFRERCAGPKHRSYTDEYGNYVDQYSEECDHTCRSYAAAAVASNQYYNVETTVFATAGYPSPLLRHYDQADATPYQPVDYYSYGYSSDYHQSGGYVESDAVVWNQCSS